MKEQLEQVRAWAQDKLAAGQEPPWAWYQYMKLRETLDAILDGMDATTTENSPQSELRLVHLRLVGTADLQDKSQHRPVGLPVQPPM